MSTTAQKPATTPIPVQLSAPEFTAFILPHLSMPKRGPKCKLGYYRIFNAVIHALRMRVERTFAWEDKFKRLLLRFECIQQRLLWHEIDGVHIDQSAQVLWHLKLATSYGINSIHRRWRAALCQVGTLCRKQQCISPFRSLTVSVYLII